MSNFEELPVPPQVLNSGKCMELVRIWIVDGEQVVAISPNLWTDAAAWGLMLADLSKHVANAYGNRGKNPQEVLSRIKEALEVEWQNPTD